MSETVADIKSMLKKITDLNDSRLIAWQNDPRAGVQAALKIWHNNRLQRDKERADFQHRFDIERTYWDQGFSHIAGIDEVGRGPLAGPVIAAAVILPHDFQAYEVIDSKQLSAKKRHSLYDIIISQAISIGIGVVDAKTIDKINIYEAARHAMTLAVEELAPEPEYLLVDAMQLKLDLPQTSLIKGDAISNSIGAASIIAKVTRDRLMAEYDVQYPGYGFSRNAGYGTREHLDGLKKLGITPIHRRTFAPIKDLYLS